MSWPRSFTCSSVAQTLAGAAYLPTSFFASEGDPFGHPYLLRGFGSLLIAVSSRPLGSFPCSYRGYTLHLIATYTLLSLSGSLPFRSAPDWQHSLHSYRAPCHLGQPPTGTSHPPILSGSLPFRSAPDWTSTANAHYLGPNIFNSFFYTLFCVVALYTISFGNCGLSAI